MVLANYQTDGYYDELFEADGQPRSYARQVVERFGRLGSEEVQKNQAAAELMLQSLGATFIVYGDQQADEKILPFDIVPRILPAREWRVLHEGLGQRVQAMNLFLQDVYNEQQIIKDGVLPEEVVKSSKGFRPQCLGIRPPLGVWCHIIGTDLVRDREGTFYVLEDGLVQKRMFRGNTVSSVASLSLSKSSFMQKYNDNARGFSRFRFRS